MERATFTVSFYIKRTKKLLDGTAPIFARITVDGQRCDFGLQRSISVDDWNPAKGCLLGHSKDVKKQNSQLDFVKMKLMEHKVDLEERGIKVTALGLKNAFRGIDENEKTILEVFQQHNDRCKSLIGIDFAQGTFDRYTSCYSHVERFIQTMYPFCLKNNVIFPVLTNQKMNAYLKEIVAVCGIDKNLSTHTARHTFATTVTLSNHVSIEVVSKMLGHSSINMTKKYARVVDDLINKDMQKIYSKYEDVKIA